MTVTGGCQCGRVRYRISGGLDHAHFCHCRMCQKAVGNVFAALVGCPRENLTWEGEGPEVFDSSSVAERPFCALCGTPLGFAYKDSDWVNVTIGSLDDPLLAPIQQHWGVEAMVPWLELGDDRPRCSTGEGLNAHQTARLKDMTSHQADDA